MINLKKIKPWTEGCWEVDAGVQLMISKEMDGWVDEALSAGAELSCNGCVRISGSFSVLIGWISSIPLSSSSRPYSLTEKKQG